MKLLNKNTVFFVCSRIGDEEHSVFVRKLHYYISFFHFISTSYDAHLQTRRRSVPPSIFVCIKVIRILTWLFHVQSLNSKQRQLRKSGNELAEADARELQRISSEQSVLQKQLDASRKQSRQHSMLMQVHLSIIRYKMTSHISQKKLVHFFGIH